MRTRRRTNSKKEKLTVSNYSYFVIKDGSGQKSSGSATLLGRNEIFWLVSFLTKHKAPCLEGGGGKSEVGIKKIDWKPVFIVLYRDPFGML